MSAALESERKIFPKSSNANAPRVLIADDQPDVLEALRLLLKNEGYQIELVSSPAGVLNAVDAREFDVVLMDLNYARDTTSGQEGLDLLSKIQAIDGTLPVVVMTAWSSVKVAVEAMRRGARDFIQKPWENERLVTILRTQIELSRALRKGLRLEAENRLLRGVERPTLIAEAPAMQPVLRLVANVGPSDANVLVTGEPGTGKEIVNISATQQAKLLRVLQTGQLERVGSSRTRQVDVRIVSATNADLNAEVVAGHFRADLQFRLNTIEIHLPPLRDRREDIPLLASHFLGKHAQRYRKQLAAFDPAAMQALLDHPWPGNIRELDHAVERAVLMAQGSTIRLGELGLRIDRDATSRIEDMSLEDVEGFLIKKAMARFDGNVSQAAKALGLSRSALYRRLQRYGL